MRSRSRRRKRSGTVRRTRKERRRLQGIGRSSRCDQMINLRDSAGVG